MLLPDRRMSPARLPSSEVEMGVRLKRVADQVIVITGATSGIGLTTARMAAERGARVVLAARDEDGLGQAVDEIRTDGGEAIAVVADVADFNAVDGLARAAINEFGGFDTWVNNAGLSIYGRLEDVPLEDARRLFDVNYWGVVNGSLAALPYLSGHGGALINIGSVCSDQALPLQGHYSASKHAVKAFTDALRMEVEKVSAPVSVTLIKPGTIDTPFPEHARSYLDAEPKQPPPVYTPDLVADAILFCAENARRDLIVGGGAKVTAAMHNAPRIAERYLEATMFEGQQGDEPVPDGRRDSLFEPMRGDVRERGNYPGRVKRWSAYTRAAKRPVATFLGAAAVGAGMILAARRLGSDD
jgi:short-subunit dehydrogenase